MGKISLDCMRAYLSKSISSFNKNKLNGILAEIDFRKYIAHIGYAERVSQGGWIARSEGQDNFGHKTVVFFPETIKADTDYSPVRPLTPPPHALHTVCATFHQIGIQSFFCTPIVQLTNDFESIIWKSKQLGIPTDTEYRNFCDCISGFRQRSRKYNFLRYDQDVSSLPTSSLPEQFSKENLHITFQNQFMAEVSDVDGIFWGERYTYPIEIKEKTVANDNKVGKYFGLDIGPFVKLAFYAAKKGNLHSLFVVKEIDHESTRDLVNWWAITYDRLAEFASWVKISGGPGMIGASSATVKIPRSEFSQLNKDFLSSL